MIATSTVTAPTSTGLATREAVRGAASWREEEVEELGVAPGRRRGWRWAVAGASLGGSLALGSLRQLVDQLAAGRAAG